MIISHKHKFIFVHVWKTGGNSVREALGAYAEGINPLRKKSLLTPFGNLIRSGTYQPPVFDQHMTLKEARAIISPKYFDQYYKFLFVRNPLDLIVSHYHFIVQSENNHPHKEYIRSLNGFGDYIKWSAENEMKFMAQNQFIIDNRGEVLADYIGRYEHLQKSFDDILNHLDILPISLNVCNRSSHDHYMNYYNSTTEEIVRSGFSEDFKLLNY